MCACAAAFTAVPAAAANSVPLAGSWILDEAASDSIEERFKHFRKSKRGGFRDGGIGGKTDRAGSGRKRRDGEDAAPRGSVRALVSATRLSIAGTEHVSIVYDGRITRNLEPNPNGRVYSASGDELVVDRFGYTLSFWDGDVLVIETTTRHGLDVVERYRVNGADNRLTVEISVTPSGEFGVDILRVFEREPTPSGNRPESFGSATSWPWRCRHAICASRRADYNDSTAIRIIPHGTNGSP